MSAKASFVALFTLAGLTATPVLAAEKADAPGVRAAAFYRGDTATLVLSRNVKSVTSPTKGVFCVTLSRKARVKDLKKTVPVATAVVEGSDTDEIFALVSTTSSYCTGKRVLEVRVIEWNGTNFTAGENDSWNLIVP